VSNPEEVQDSAAIEQREPEAGAQPRHGASGAARRPLSLLREKGLRYVNRMRNVGWLAGYCLPGEGNQFLLQQNNNIEHALRIQSDGRARDLSKSAGRPLLVRVHVRGARDEHGPQAQLHCISVDNPSYLDLPSDSVWASGFGDGKAGLKVLSEMARANFNPFDENGEIRKEYKQYIKVTDAEARTFVLDERAKQFVQAQQLLGDVMQASGSVIDSRLDRGQNYISIAGFVDAKAWIAENDYRSGYALLMVRQHEDQERNIPVRVTGKQANAYYKRIEEGSPVLIEGSARRKVIPDDAGNIVSHHTYIETKRVSPARAQEDILYPLPEWWMTIRDRLLARAQSRQAEAAAQVAARAASVETDTFG